MSAKRKEIPLIPTQYTGYDAVITSPPEPPDPPDWVIEYRGACELIGCTPDEPTWDDDGRLSAIKNLEGIRDAAEAALEVI